MFAGVVRWLLSLRLPARRPLEPTTSVLIRELVNIDDELAVAGGRAARKPGGLRARLAVLSCNTSSFLRFDMRGGG